ncbi:MAG TPA: rRNA maturation RNase YbeY [Allosphingosinicella sp.]|nr:rRNA maturation RNase YbeY [Allosphingosinicella sp.]
MIMVDAVTGAEWSPKIDWPALAAEAGRAAVAHSRHAALIDSGLAVELSVKFTGDSQVQALNAAYRNKNQPTNVLAFPMLDAGLLDSVAGADGGEILLGDVVLAHGVCSAEAADKGVTREQHASHLVVHGVLHLLGYDHGEDEEAEAMERIEREALASIGIADPYEAEEVRP